MKYKGVIKGSRTLDLTMVSQLLDAAAAPILLYNPEQLGVTVPAYLVVRIIINTLQAYLRFKTNTAVGEK